MRLLAAVWLVALVFSNDQALRLNVSPKVSIEPAFLRLQIRLAPDPSDRWIVVRTDGPNFYRLSGFTIEGDRKLYTVDWPSVPSGDYSIVASVGHGDVTRAADHQRVLVVQRF